MRANTKSLKIWIEERKAIVKIYCRNYTPQHICVKISKEINIFPNKKCVISFCVALFWPVLYCLPIPRNKVDPPENNRPPSHNHKARGPTLMAAPLKTWALSLRHLFPFYILPWQKSFQSKYEKLLTNYLANITQLLKIDISSKCLQ